MKALLSALFLCGGMLAVPVVAQETSALGSASASSASSSASSAANVNAASKAEDADAVTPRRELAVDRGNLTFYPVLNIGLGYRSNLFDSDGDRQGSAFTNLRAGAGVQGDNRGHLYGAEYTAERYWYLEDDVPDDDQITQRAVAYWGTGFDVRNNLDLGVEYLDSYDGRGQDDPRRDIRENTAGERPDTWTQLAYGANYAYGAPGARGRIEAGACETCKRYDNNDQEYRDRDITDLGVTFFARATGRSEVFAQVVYTDFDYRTASFDSPAQGRNLDSEEWRYMLGVSWLASERLTGIARAGIVTKEFADPVRGNADYQEITWNAILNWTPTSRDRVALGYFRSPQEPLVWEQEELQDGLVETQQLSLDWSHRLRDDLMFDVGGYVGSDAWDPSGRDDDLRGARAGLRYSLPRWGSLGVSYYRRERNSSDPTRDYTDEGIVIDFNIGALFGFGGSRAPAVCLLRSFSSGNGYNALAG
jgi:hypothetical protein